jgi:hypothetical protein
MALVSVTTIESPTIVTLFGNPNRGVVLAIRPGDWHAVGIRKRWCR